MTDDDDLERFVSNVSGERLSAALGIDCDVTRLPRWEIAVANGDRTEEFLDYYERNEQLDDDDKFAMMALTVASFDDWCFNAPAGHPLPGRLRDALIRNFRTHAATIYYWCMWDEPDLDNVFRITPFMREVWCTQRPRPENLPER